MKLASSFAAAFPLLKDSASRAQLKPGTEATVFEMADFVKGAPGRLCKSAGRHLKIGGRGEQGRQQAGSHRL
jgi:hypothetical protein